MLTLTLAPQFSAAPKHAATTLPLRDRAAC